MMKICNHITLQRHVTMNGYVAFEIAVSKYFIIKIFSSLIPLSLQKEQLLFSTTGYAGKYQSVVKGFYTNKIKALPKRILATGQ